MFRNELIEKRSYENMMKLLILRWKSSAATVVIYNLKISETRTIFTPIITYYNIAS